MTSVESEIYAMLTARPVRVQMLEIAHHVVMQTPILGPIHLGLETVTQNSSMQTLVNSSTARPVQLNVKHVMVVQTMIE